MKAKRDLDVLPPTHGALELQSQGKTIKLRYGFKQTMNLENKLTETIDL